MPPRVKHGVHTFAMPGWKRSAQGGVRILYVLRRTFALGLLSQFATLAPARAQDAARNIVIVGPEIDLFLRTAVGRLEIRPDWTQSAREYFHTALAEQFSAAGWTHQFVARDTLLEGRVGQIVRLHTLVADVAFSQQQRRRRGMRLQQMSLGSGAQELAIAYGAERALFVEGAGAYASAGRNIVSVASNANAIIWALSGDIFAAATLGLRATRKANRPIIRFSLVDLISGDITWLRELDAEDDPRTAEGAASIVAELLEHAPL